MTNHLFRRSFVLTILVLTLVVGMNALPDKVPGGPLGWSWFGDGSKIDPLAEVMAGSNIGMDKPVLLRYLTWLFGDDWLGANWLYLGLDNYRYPKLDENSQRLINNNPNTGGTKSVWNYARFWTDPGPALLKPGEIIWVWGYPAGGHLFYADNILVEPPARVAPPDEVNTSGSVLRVVAQTITIQDAAGIRSTVTVDQYTTYSFPAGDGMPRPKDGLWLNISWLTGPTGLLGRYAGYHGNYHGILRLDFSERLNMGK